MKFVAIHYDNTVAGIEVYRKKNEGQLGFGNIKWSAEEGAREFIHAIEDDCCIAFLEALSLEAQRSINRHAKAVFDQEDWGEDRELPEWATKYQEAGL